MAYETKPTAATAREAAPEPTAARRRGLEPTPREVGLEDRRYWADLYAGDDE